MSSLTKSPLPTLQAVSSSFAALQEVLEPLLGEHTLEAITQTLQEREDPSDLEGRLDSARLQVSVAYVLLDLVWIYLKTKGMDPSNHPVLSELERVKGYFTKIKAVQDTDKEEDRLKLDRSAAGRFIRAALASGAGKHTKFDEDGSPAASPAPAAEEEKEEEEKSAASTPAPAPASKRPKRDPFEGYDESPAAKRQPEPEPEAEAAESTPSPKKKKRKSKK